MILTLLKLAFGGIRTRLLASLFTVLLAATATTTIVLALEVGSTVDDPWRRTFQAARGADVLAIVPTVEDARAIAARSGVVESDDPTPTTDTEVHLPGGSETILIAGLVAQPRLNIPPRRRRHEQAWHGHCARTQPRRGARNRRRRRRAARRRARTRRARHRRHRGHPQPSPDIPARHPAWPGCRARPWRPPSRT